MTRRDPQHRGVTPSDGSRRARANYNMEDDELLLECVREAILNDRKEPTPKWFEQFAEEVRAPSPSTQISYLPRLLAPGTQSPLMERQMAKDVKTEV